MAKPSQLKRSGAGDPNYIKDMVARGKAQSEMKKFEKSISPEGMAKANADAKKALENKYPGMFIPETRTTPGVKRK